MYIALRLLRDGAHTDAHDPVPARRRPPLLGACRTAPDWMHRLKIVGIDLRDPTQVLALTDDVAADGPLDILINNACQTVRRSPGAYAKLLEMESAPLPDLAMLPEMVTFDRISEAHPAAIAGALTAHAGRPPRRRADRAGPGCAQRRVADGVGTEVRQRLPGGAPGRHGGRRRRVAARHPGEQLLDPGGLRGRSAGAAGGAVLQLHRPVPAHLAAAPGDAGRRRRQAERGAPNARTW